MSQFLEARITLRLTPEQHQRVTDIALAKQIGINSVIGHAIDHWLSLPPKKRDELARNFRPAKKWYGHKRTGA